MARDLPGTSNDYLTAGDIPNYDGPAISVFCWYKPDVQPSGVNQWLLNNFYPWTMQLNSDWTITIHMIANPNALGVSRTSTATFALSQWNSLGFFYTGNSSTGGTMVNGTVESAIVYGTGLAGTTGAMQFGRAATCNGRLAEVAIWNAALSSPNWAALHAGAKPETIATGNLIDVWPLIGNTSPEPSLLSARSLTVVGTVPGVPGEHPISRSTFIPQITMM